MTIVEELRQNRESGAKRLESEYKAGLMSLARRICVDPSDAEELVNSTFATVVENIDDYLEQSAFFAWMCQILTRLHAMNMRRKSNKTVIYPGVVPDIVDEDAQEAIYNNLDASLLRDAINQLPDDQREVILLRYFIDMPVAKIAKFLSIPAGTVHSRLHYAKMALAGKLGVAMKKPGGKAVLAILILCTLTALGAVGIATRGEFSWRAADAGSGRSRPAATAIGETGETSGSGGSSPVAATPTPVPPDSPVPPVADVPFVADVPSTTLSSGDPTMNTTLRTIAASAAFAAASAAMPTTASAADAYVGSEGANIIYTDYYANPNTRIELDFQYTTGGGMIVSPWVRGSGLATALWNAGTDNGGMQFLVGDTTASTDGKRFSSGHTLTTKRRFLSIDCAAGILKFANHGEATNVIEATGATFTQTANWPVCLLGSTRSTDGTTIEPTHLARARIFWCRIYEKEGGEYVLKRNYVPVLRDGAACLHDTITDTFAVDPRSGAAALNYGGDIQEVGHGYIQSVAGVGLNTGYKMKATSRVELDCALTSTTVSRPMGCWNGASTLRDLVWADSKVKFFINSGSGISTDVAVDTGRHTYVIDQVNAKGRYLTGATLLKEVSGTAASADAVSSNPLSIFADSSNASGTSWSQPATGMKCYGLKIYESDVLVTNFVPYVRNGEIGFRDTLTGAFLSAGTTNFVAGGNIELSGPTARDAFVESDGTQILNTGYKVGSQSRVEVDLAVRVPAKGFLFGNFASGAGLRWSAWQNSATGPLRFSGGSGGSNTDIMNPGPGTERIKAIYDVKNAQGWIVRDGVAQEKKNITAPGGLSCAFPMGVFGSLANSEGTAVDNAISPAMTAMRVYSVRIYEGDGAEPAAEFLPCKGADGIGLYDTKTGRMALKHSASVSDPTIGGMGVDGTEKWLVLPAATAVPVDGAATVSANAAGALRYLWTLGSETLEGQTGPAASVTWRRGTRGQPVAGTVTPIYTVFGAETEGEPIPFSVVFNPETFVIIMR